MAITSKPELRPRSFLPWVDFSAVLVRNAQIPPEISHRLLVPVLAKNEKQAILTS